MCQVCGDVSGLCQVCEDGGSVGMCQVCGDVSGLCQVCGDVSGLWGWWVCDIWVRSGGYVRSAGLWKCEDCGKCVRSVT